MFPLSFPLLVLADARPGEWVLDPFCGRGTTLFAARMRGLASLGIDSNAVAAAIAQAKLVNPHPRAIVALANELLARPAADVPQGTYWTTAFHPDVLDQVCRLRSGLLDRTDASAAALRGITLGALHGPRNKGVPSYFSNQMPRTYSTKPGAALNYWSEHEMTAPQVDVVNIIERLAKRRYVGAPPRVQGDVVCGGAADSLKRLRRNFSWVVTSPPYPGMVTYRPDGWLRGWFVGGPPQPDYDRTDQLGSFTGHLFVDGLAEIWEAVANRCLPGAHMVVRFGALPSLKAGEPEDLMLSTLDKAGGWRVTRVEDAGIPAADGARQADQAIGAGDHVPEVDVYCILDRQR